VLKERVTGFKVYSTHLNEQESPSRHKSKGQCPGDMVDFRVSLQQVPCVIPTYVNTTFDPR